MAEWVKLTELGDRKCDAVKFNWNDIQGKIDGGFNYCFSRVWGECVPTDNDGSFRFDFSACNVVDYNLNGGGDINYGYYQDATQDIEVLNDGVTYQGTFNDKDYNITVSEDKEVMWEWTEPLYYYGDFYRGFGTYDDEPVAADGVYVRLYEGGEVEPDEPDTPVDPDEPTIESNLARIIRAKAEIKAAIESKGVTVDEGTIDTYASKIYEISQSGGSCKIESRWFDFEDLDNGNCWWYASDNDLDGFSFISVNASNYGNQKYQEGYDQGKSEGGGESINPLAEGMKFAYATITKVPEWANLPQDATDISDMFNTCSQLTDISKLSEWDVSNTTYASRLFAKCSKLTDITPINGWNISKWYSLNYLFENTSITESPSWDISGVKELNYFLSGTYNTLERMPKYNVGKAYGANIFGFESGQFTKLTDVGGLEDLKISLENNYGFYRCPNLSYQSLLNIISGLYDYSETGEERKLKFHPNAYNLLTEDDIAEAARKGWSLI